MFRSAFFQLQTACPVRARFQGRAEFFAAEPGLLGRRLLVGAAALSLVAAVATLPRQESAIAVADAAPARTIMLHAPSATELRDQAEALRADLLARPGVRAVTIDGLRQQRFMVDISAKRLAALGMTQADMQAALPIDPAASHPGHYALRADSPVAGFQEVADLPVRAGSRVFRLGDIAGVIRAPLAAPVSTMAMDGQPAARLTVVSAP